MKRMNLKFRKKKVLLLSFSLLLLTVVFFSVWVDSRVSGESKGKIYTDVENVPFNKVGLLLGTSKKLSNGKTNLYYKYRIEAAVKLFRSGKINYVLVSGDNSKKTYDEPTDMHDDLLAAGVPDSCIILDYAGFRTWDSVVRCHDIFGQDSITVISQPFHIERAVFIADHKGICAVGYAARNVTKRFGFKTNVREKLARVKLFVDIMIGKEPKFGGERIEIR